jgi:hypothetical protein
MLRKQWQDYALKAKQIAKHIVTGLEQNKKGVRLIQIVYGLDIYATDALNLKYSKQRSKSSVHTYQGGRQEISTQHADGSEGLFKSNGEFHPTNNPMDTEVKEYMNNNLDENKQYKANTNMNKKLIRLTESDLHRIVKQSVNKILKEGVGDNAYLQQNIQQAIFSLSAVASVLQKESESHVYGGDSEMIPDGNAHFEYNKVYELCLKTMRALKSIQ